MLFRKRKDEDVVTAYQESYKKVMNALYTMNAVSDDEMKKMLEQNAMVCEQYRKLTN